MKVVVFVHTEYHLMLTVNEILKNPMKLFKVYILNKPNRRRLNLGLALDLFSNAKFQRVLIPVDYSKSFSREHNNLLEDVSHRKYKELYFFQEHDALLLSIIKTVKKINRSCQICLFQDGLKPYNRLKGFSFGMLKYDIQTWWWLWKNGLKEIAPLKLLETKKYAYSNEIDEVYLTFPESYVNWNNKRIRKIEFCEHSILKASLEKLFCWYAADLPLKKNVILYMTQPVYQDLSVEFNFLVSLKKQLNMPMILKLHPLTNQDSIQRYKSIGDDVYIIDSVLPAEIYIMNLTESVIVSLNSTSMFYNSPGNRYYYASSLFLSKIKRLRRYDFSESPSKHINMAKNISDII